MTSESCDCTWCTEGCLMTETCQLHTAWAWTILQLKPPVCAYCLDLWMCSNIRCYLLHSAIPWLSSCHAYRELTQYHIQLVHVRPWYGVLYPCVPAEVLRYCKDAGDYDGIENICLIQEEPGIRASQADQYRFPQQWLQRSPVVIDWGQWRQSKGLHLHHADQFEFLRSEVPISVSQWDVICFCCWPKMSAGMLLSSSHIQTLYMRMLMVWHVAVVQLLWLMLNDIHQKLQWCWVHSASRYA